MSDDDSGESLDINFVESTFDFIHKLIVNEIGKQDTLDNPVLQSFFGECMEWADIEEVIYGSTEKTETGIE